ncbi:hypothetical protein BJX66DRAFT_319055 [Aspergillus keveii]|uniref:Uncharacterized protein n=1 Tax=Aspergillus keveii TaxID=714993 RepID=A0ABR4FJE3_9EURO
MIPAGGPAPEKLFTLSIVSGAIFARPQERSASHRTSQRHSSGHSNPCFYSPRWPAETLVDMREMIRVIEYGRLVLVFAEMRACRIPASKYRGDIV